jgi:hypothetical protein
MISVGLKYFLAQYEKKKKKLGALPTRKPELTM